MAALTVDLNHAARTPLVTQTRYDGALHTWNQGLIREVMKKIRRRCRNAAAHHREGIVTNQGW